MYKIPPSYYLKRAAKAEDFNTWLNMTIAFWRMSAVHAHFISEQYKNSFVEMFSNMSKIALKESR